MPRCQISLFILREQKHKLREEVARSVLAHGRRRCRTVSFTRLLGGLVEHASGLSDEFGDEDGASLRKVFPVDLDAFNLMKRIRSKVALAAVWTYNQRNILDEKQILTPAERFSDPSDARPRLATILANQPTYSTFHVL